MTSKSSSWVDLKENSKRRLWQWCVSIFLFVVFDVLGYLIAILGIDKEDLRRTYGVMGEDMIRRSVKSITETFMGVSANQIFFVTVVAALLGIGGYAYLNNRIKVDFYESMPAKKGSRFFTIWFTGMLIFVSSYIVGMLLEFVILTASGYGDVYSMEEALKSFVTLFFYFLGVYHTAMLAVMLTGTIFTSVCAFIVLSCYEFVIRGLIFMYKSAFFRYSYTLSSDFTPIASPYGLLAYVIDKRTRGGEIPYMTGLILLDIVLLILSYVFYVRRPREGAGKTIIFKWMKPVLKLLITFPVAAFMAEIIHDTVKGDMTSVVVAAAITVITSILVSALVQGVFEQDIRLAFKKKINWILCSVAALLIFFGFKGDWFNIDRYIPDPSFVSSVSFCPSGYDNRYAAMTPEGTYSDIEEYTRNYMFLSDSKTICDLTRLSMEKYDAHMEIVDGDPDYMMYEDNGFSYAVVLFRLKNGHTVAKSLRIPVEDPDVTEMLDTVMSSTEFKKSFYDLYNFDYETAIRSAKPTDLSGRYTDGVWEKKLGPDDLVKLTELYLEDVEDVSYKDRLGEYPKGTVRYCIEEFSGVSTWGPSIYEVALPIYPCMERTVEYLASKGYDVDTMDYIDQIAGMSIFDYHYDEQEEYTNSLDDPNEADPDILESFVKRQDYDGADIQKIVPHLRSTSESYERWDGGLDLDYEYTANVQFYGDSEIGRNYEGYEPTYSFLEGEVPGFVADALALD